ncbi:hypothetical protein BSPLISOX_233 [uncultured Gammaproteobacteria bacterium]|nr:hypothetical protein [uncultured Gammaproteobacteria bacterium]VVH65471.1 hypothetical protein BSPLISOX_233 [uncultured Gammaproteobacteria bacterium]
MIGKIEVGNRKLDTLEFINYCQALKMSPCKTLQLIGNSK